MNAWPLSRCSKWTVSPTITCCSEPRGKRVGVRLKNSSASARLQTFLRGLFEHPDRDVLRIKDAGGEGDCLFHATGAALENMLRYDVKRPNHVLQALSLDDFGRGDQHLVQTLRGLAAERILKMTNEDFLNFVITLAQQKMLGVGWYDGWNPVRELRLHGFDMLCKATIFLSENFKNSLSV